MKRDNTALYEKLSHASAWDEFTKDEKWTIHSLQSSDYLYHTKFIKKVFMPFGGVLYAANDDRALRLRLGIGG